MRILGIAALLSALLSFVLWFAGWLYWNVLITELGVNSPARYAAMSSGVLSAIFEFVAIALLSIGIIAAAKRIGDAKP